MTFEDFKLNFREAYRTGSDPEGKIEKSNEDLLTREFGDYPSDRLEKVWKAIRRHHKTAFFPSIGQMLEAMDKNDVNEYKNTSRVDRLFNKCSTCGCYYSFRSRVCPDCNRPLADGEIFHNQVTIYKDPQYQQNHVTCNDNCSICPLFKQNRNIRGAKCDGWGKEQWEKESFPCSNCDCKSCCEMLAKHDEKHEIGSLFSYIKSNASNFNDPNWLEIYKKKEIKKGYIYNYAGVKYENITGKYAGRSPKMDKDNWK